MGVSSEGRGRDLGTLWREDVDLTIKKYNKYFIDYMIKQMRMGE